MIEQLIFLLIPYQLSNHFLFRRALVLFQLDNCLHNFVDNVLQLVRGMGDGVQLFPHHLLNIEASHNLLSQLFVFGGGLNIFMFVGYGCFSFFGLDKYWLRVAEGWRNLRIFGLGRCLRAFGL